jgi:hypothetical protein
MAAGGTTPTAALEAFRASFTEVLKDFAADAGNFRRRVTALKKD